MRRVISLLLHSILFLMLVTGYALDAAWGSEFGDYGVEGIRYFSDLRAQGYDADDLTYTYNRTNGFNEELRDGGYTKRFYYAQDNCWERDLKSEHLSGGLDAYYGDTVDIFYIDTHGNFWSGSSVLAYDIDRSDWVGRSANWRLGDLDLEWLAMYACGTLTTNASTLWANHGNVFYGLHMLLGSYDDFYDSWYTEECGEDFAANLVDGDTIRYSWFDGISDWWHDQDMAIISVERQSTYNGGSFDWPNTVLYRDRYTSRQPDINRSDIYWIARSMLSD